jgi:chaperone BCS1
MFDLSGIISLSKENPVVAGAVSLWGLGVLTYIVRNLPKSISNTLYTQLTTSVEINNAGYWANKYLFLSFNEWFTRNKHSKYSRSFTADIGGEEDNKVVLGAGYGRHFFVFNGRLFWFRKSKQENSVSPNVKEDVYISTYGRSRKPIFDLIKEITPPNIIDGKMSIFTLDKHNEWYPSSNVDKRDINSVILKKETKAEILNEIDSFIKNKEWYVSNGLSYKLTFIFHGEPGCGKSSLIKAIASSYNKNIYSLNLHAIKDNDLTTVVNEIKRGSVLIIEDFDTASAAVSREQGAGEFVSKLSMSTLLNCLDGVVPLDDLIIFLTTNHLDKIDPAIKRKGRVDKTIEITKLTTNEIKEYVSYVYKEDLKGEFKDLPGCDLQSLVLTHKQDFDSFEIDLINKYRKDGGVY